MKFAVAAAVSAISLALLSTACAQLPPPGTPVAAGAPPVSNSSGAPVPLTSPSAPDVTGAAAAAAARWHADLAAFDQADRAHSPTPGSVLFVGSSTIRFWTTLAHDFPYWPGVMNRGFGGSTLTECALLADRLVVRYRPARIVLYAGDNDLAQGHTPQQVMEDFIRFAGIVRAALPGIRIDYISIKPSPLREALTANVRQANALISAQIKSMPNTGYIDVYSAMVAADGRPRTELFLPDRLHMNGDGYRIWQSAVAAATGH